ncbi:MAG: hypothetical protein WAW10_13415 [Gallionella sp.]
MGKPQWKQLLFNGREAGNVFPHDKPGLSVEPYLRVVFFMQGGGGYSANGLLGLDSTHDSQLNPKKAVHENTKKSHRRFTAR